MRYSFITEERPTVRVPAPEPTREELLERLANTEHQIALLVARRERILQKLGT